MKKKSPHEKIFNRRIPLCILDHSHPFISQGNCINNAADYVSHIEDLLNKTSQTSVRPLCDDTDLMTRIQSVKSWMKWEQESLE